MVIGIPELLIVLAIVLLVLGPKRLPGLGRSLGGGVRNFRAAIRGRDDRRLPAPADDEALDGDVVPDRRA